MVQYINSRSFVGGNPSEFIEYVEKADSCYGISVGNYGATESNFIEVYVMKSPFLARKMKYWFLKSNNSSLYAKTLSFVKNIDNKVYIFHSRYMGASWYLKKDFEWFEDTLKIMNTATKH